MLKSLSQSFLNINLTDANMHQFRLYYEKMIAFNSHTNLTRITDYEEVVLKHFIDSLSIVKSVDILDVKTICDIGAGAGFPSLPLKIAYPHLHIVIVEASLKRVNFLKELIAYLALDHVDIFHDRAEVFAVKHQATYDMVTARAVGSIGLVTELGLPMVKTGGHLLLLKGPQYELELKDAQSGIILLGGAVQKIKVFELPQHAGARTHVLIKKHKHVKGYPRSFAAMQKKPL